MTMFRNYMKLALLAACLSIVGCDQINHYGISEARINQALLKHNDFHKQLGLPGIAQASIRLTELHSEIGRSQPDRFTLSGQADVEIQWLASKKQAKLRLTMSAKPVLDAAKGAIYLQDISLDHCEINPDSMNSALNSLKPMLQESLKDYFNTHPAYVLSYQHRWSESVIKHLASRLEVKPGQLVIYFQ